MYGPWPAITLFPAATKNFGLGAPRPKFFVAAGKSVKTAKAHK